MHVKQLNNAGRIASQVGSREGEPRQPRAYWEDLAALLSRLS